MVLVKSVVSVDRRTRASNTDGDCTEVAANANVPRPEVQVELPGGQRFMLRALFELNSPPTERFRLPSTFRPVAMFSSVSSIAR